MVGVRFTGEKEDYPSAIRVAKQMVTLERARQISLPLGGRFYDEANAEATWGRRGMTKAIESIRG